ncbi:putative TIM-barrel protein, nifR3 family [Methanosarcina thermophila]|jgi:tRNA-dihydrouridine synthase B|uniref:tRNA dihydrouridine synthase B n=3 Tax=Methanosarcina thermophila TaxID=2210 RepID=A0A0E3NDG0_METTE|nr:tRNA dihydrouridine synthase DusB [Methanosarcina thermophila]ALK04885.1 MAG: TIM-barrel protein, nifR3 family [Methanosarcina sp. 795]AKB13604.1 tRNA dihydrouridine synthase B [Methanosarcina thermophila TM-1]AKB15758.1 tRNA dihydrouridine synthase B [Methanosarcina thermophila CHTI-55]NLU58394.1 tRNA dihydrouridine synthase DusB [Methanosarcina thermophila]SFT62290.1 putative TIM-barrel protein, nifR3 family [Methanosarcina thermophila]
MKLNKLKIGKIETSGNLLLAPMADVTNLAFRLLCRQNGADITYTEMISADALLNRNRKALLKGLSSPADRPFGIQLVGSSPEKLREAAIFIEDEYKPELIDVNMGCPAKRITGTGCGSALLNSKTAVYEIISEMTAVLKTPVTAKIRILEREEKTLEIARLIERAGASALTVHGRKAKQMYSGSSDLAAIRAVKRELSIPVIANGDIRDEESAEATLDFTGCDGLMIGRAAIGNPFIFKRIKHYLETGEKLEVNRQAQQLEDLKTYVALLEEYNLCSSTNVRMHAHWFTKGLHGSRQIREKINNLKDGKALIELIGNYSQPK